MDAIRLANLRNRLDAMYADLEITLKSIRDLERHHEKLLKCIVQLEELIENGKKRDKSSSLQR